MLKKALSLLLLVLLALTLAACDGDSAPLNESGGGASTPSADTAQGGANGNEPVAPEESNPTPDNKNEPSTPEDSNPEDGYIDLPKVEF
jgi:hypothetical protein